MTLERGILTDRERELVELATQGLTDKQVCHRLGLTMPTVRTYWTRVRRKLGVANKAQAVATMVQQARMGESGINGHLIQTLSGVDVGYWVWMPRSDRVYLDPNAREIFGLPREMETVTKEKFLACTSPRHRWELLAYLQRLESCKPLTTLEHQVNSRAHFRWPARTANIAQTLDHRGEPNLLLVTTVQREDPSDRILML